MNMAELCALLCWMSLRVGFLDFHFSLFLMFDIWCSVYALDKYSSDYSLSVGFTMSKEGHKTEVEGELLLLSFFF